MEERKGIKDPSSQTVSSTSVTLEDIMRKDFPLAEEFRRQAEHSKKKEDFEIALRRYIEILEKFESMDSPDIYLLGFGFDCYKSAVYLQLLLKQDNDALTYTGKLILEELKNLKIILSPHSENKLNALSIDDDILKLLPWEKITYIRFEIFVLSVLLLVKTRYLTTLLYSNEDPQISSLECFIEVLENSPEQSVERKLAAQQPAIDLIKKLVVNGIVEIQSNQILGYIDKLTGLIQSNLFHRSTEIKFDRTWIILEESMCLIGKECHRFHGSAVLVEKVDSLKAVISKVESMGVILTDINLQWGTWTQ